MKSRVLALFLLLIPVLAFLWWRVLDEPGTIGESLAMFREIPEGPLSDFESKQVLPLVRREGKFVVSDTRSDGISIIAPALSQESKPEISEGMHSYEVLFPEQYSESVEIKLPEERSIRIFDASASEQTFSPELLASGETERVLFGEGAGRDDTAPPWWKKLLGSGEEHETPYLRYESEDRRKSLYYAYERDVALGGRMLKHWTVYASGSGTENESYRFENAKLQLRDDGSVSAYYFSDTLDTTAVPDGTVEPNLLDRARATLAKDFEENLSSLEPDIIIPRPYVLDRTGQRTDLSWRVEGNFLKLTIAVSADRYPLALDPTLSFTVPGQNNSGSVIDAEGSGGLLGNTVATSDLNADGKTDLVVGATGYSSSAGRVYVFYHDGKYPRNASEADLTITGEASSAFGRDIAFADVNTDGRLDLIVGGYAYSTDDGRVYVFFMDSSIPTSAASADIIITGEPNLRFGLELHTEDLNTDGEKDLIVSAYGTVSSTSRVYIFYNDGSIPTTAATADVIISAEANGNFLGYSLTSGDFNADGRSDLAVGAIGYSTSTGRVYVFYNDGAGLGTVVCTTGCLAANADVIITGQATNNSFGDTLLSADLNADGKNDLVVGASNYSTGTGRVYVFYNGAIITENATGADVTITGEAAPWYFGGFSLVSGDFNSDGRADLATSSTVYGSNTGRVYIFYNDGSIPTTAVTADIIITGERTGSEFGSAMVTGDFNFDGADDIAVSARGYLSNTGRVYVFYSQNGQVNTNQSISGEASSAFGSAIAPGDFNADGNIDIAVSAPSYSSSAGRVYIFYGDGSLPSTATGADVTITGEASSSFGSLVAGDFNADGKTDLAVGASTITTNTGKVYVFYNGAIITENATGADAIMTGGGTSHSFGGALAAGDLNGDGKTDLLVGAKDYGFGTGLTYIFYNGSITTESASGADIIIAGESTSDGFGFSLVTGDFNADGRVDLAASARTYPGTPWTGRVYVFYNDGTSLGTVVCTTGCLAANADVILSGESIGSDTVFGHSLSAGDFNADGRTDLAAGAMIYSSGIGRVYIFYNDGNSLGTVSCTTDCLAVNADVIITGTTVGYYFSHALSSGDFNADGRTDLVVGSYNYNSARGAAYIFYNDGSYPTSLTGADVVISGEAANMNFGASFASADIDGDGRTNLLVGASIASSGAGAIYIYETRENFAWTLQRVQSFRAQPYGGGEELSITGETGAASVFGTSLATGDFNNDGKTDLAVGARAYATNTGRVSLFYTDGSFPRSSNNADVIITGAATNTYFGSAITSGDFNNDGKTDLAVGAGVDPGSVGSVYVFWNDGSLPTNAASADITITGEGANNGFGGSLATGDLNADGKIDLIAGAAGHASSVGRAYVFWNGSIVTENASGADVIISGEGVNHKLGNAFATGDFNADGKTDLVVGAYNYPTNAGRAYVFWNGSIVTENASGADVIISGVDGDEFGRAFAAGDFNFDGKTDLAVGAKSSGTVYIFYNGSIITESATGADVTITGETGSGYFGNALSSGDYNRDGRTDLAVGAPLHASSVGRAYIFFNDGSIPTTAATADIILRGESTSTFGGSLLSGDFNADGKTDLVVGASTYDSSTGRVYLYTLNEDVRITGGAGSDLFGRKMTTGDFNSDGKIDLAVGARGYSSSTGRIYLFYGGKTLPNSTTNADSIITGEAVSNDFGFSSAAADLNADGRTDLVVGARGYSSSTGRVYVFYNDGVSFGTVGCTTDCLAANADVILTGTAGIAFANTVEAADLNADSRADLVVSATSYSSSTGRVYVFYNDGVSFGTVGCTTDCLAANADVMITGEASNNSLGIAISSADLNADSRIDLVIGASGYNSSAGRVYVFYNDGVSFGTVGCTTDCLAANADVILTGETSSSLSRSISLDANRDGRKDLVLGGFNAVSNVGRVYVFYNDGVSFGTVGCTTDCLAANADVILTGETGSRFGVALSDADLNIDGRDDLVVGGYTYSSSTGRVYVFYNDGVSFGTVGCTTDCLAANADVILTGENTNDQFGLSLATADIGTDGKKDIVVGSEGYSTSTGRVYVFITEAEAVGAAGLMETHRVRGTAKFKGNVQWK